ncbi:hypothetical protein J5N97_018729 [Dioscorea zingiberensis]|uniref:Uncharacterized protein n=1 Tax=Dioscorea zingiberensis TaxID=325984 RepID=A0A9D5HC09_9LILI|nr:hypothetical protein J5N97_018729 [Dioscorea zingiberensis]
MFSIVRRNPFNDGSHWYYELQGPIDVRDAPSLSIDTLPPLPSLIVSLIFSTQTIFCTRPGPGLVRAQPPRPIETREFTMDIKSFTNQSSADLDIYYMFMDTMTGRSLSPQRRLWMVTTLSESIRRYFHGSSISSTLDANIIFQLDVVDEILHEEIEEEEHFMQENPEEWLEDEEEEFPDDVEYLSTICPAPPALVESLKTEVYQSDQEGADSRKKCALDAEIGTLILLNHGGGCLILEENDEMLAIGDGSSLGLGFRRFGRWDGLETTSS